MYVCTPLSLLQGDSIDFVPFKKLPDLLNELLQKLVTLDFNAKELLMKISIVDHSSRKLIESKTYDTKHI